ncbi:hypothetical protein MMC14_001868 [Varicellaria rhodocarpa]|nr:hypothetical protein [Varicellaria rhodocarpa]
MSYGLLELVELDNAKVDIVLVHGLHGDREKTWTKNLGNDSICWPKDLLPSDVKKTRTNRPIIFVAHSLGGLICANGILDAASSRQDIKELAICVRRIAFLGTPHQGSKKAQWTETARKFLALFKETNTELLRDLDENSATLAKLGEQFPILLRSRTESPETEIEIVCFFEGSPTKVSGVGIGMIVEEKSAFLPGYTTTLLDTDHQGMCKFADREDVNYQRLSGLLAKWTEELEKSHEESPKQTDQHSSHTTFSGPNNSGFQLGHNAGNLNGFTFGGSK